MVATNGWIAVSLPSLCGCPWGVPTRAAAACRRVMLKSSHLSHLTPLGARQSYSIDTTTLALIEVAVIGILEGFRYGNWKKTGAPGVGPIAPFDPMGMASEETKLKELKNGRLAMLAFIGFCSQAAVNGKGPIECLTDHIADPNHVNIYTSSVGKETAVTVAVLCVYPMIIEVQKTLNKGQDSTPVLFPWAAPWEEK
eukprot:98634-Chlamydomonas_euryale.AAC.3